MIGQTVSHYRILEKLGEGGMGVVYKAQDLKLERPVALKFLPPDLTRDPETRRRFAHEAKTTSTLQHNAICTIHDIDETPDGQMFIVMDFYKGETLKQKIERGPLPLKDVLAFGAQVTDGLTAAHEAGIVHRDIKPANILITDRGEVKLLDFGLARLSGQTRLTREGSTPGTLAYMSPEQIRGNQVDHRTDLWSTGVVLHEMLTGKHPFKGEFEQAMAYSIMNGEPEPVTSLRSGLPMDLDVVLKKALSKDPGERYQHADDLRADLRRLMHEDGSSTHLSGAVHTRAQAKPSRRRIFLISAGVSVLLAVPVVLAIHYFLTGSDIGEPIPIAVISFENQTGEAKYDHLSKAIPNLLITALEQSPGLRVTTWERLRDLARQTGNREPDQISQDLAFSLCRASGVQALVVGSFTRAGEEFATDAKVLDVDSRNIVVSARSRGESEASILRLQIDALSDEIIQKILRVPQQTGVARKPITEFTTNSLEAYSYYLAGMEKFENLDILDALKLFTLAIERDSTFAIAYLQLARTLGSLSRVAAQTEMCTRAFQLSSRASEKERMYIEAGHALLIQRDRAKQIAIFEAMKNRFPNEKQVRFDLGAAYVSSGQQLRAMAELEAGIRLDPDYGPAVNHLAYVCMDQENFGRARELLTHYRRIAPDEPNPYDSWGDFYVKTGDLDSALTMFREAVKRKPDFFASSVKIALVLALREEYDSAISELDGVAQRLPAGGAMAFSGMIAALTGRPAEAGRGWSYAHETWKTFGATQFLLFRDISRAWALLAAHRPHEAARTIAGIQGILAKMPRREQARFRIVSQLPLVESDLLLGHFDFARMRLAAMTDSLGTLDQWARKVLEYEIGVSTANILLAEGRADSAITYANSLRLPPSPPLYSPGLGFLNLGSGYPARYNVIARACLAMGDTLAAVRELEQQIRVYPERPDFRFVNPVLHYELAVLLDRIGEVDRAWQQYTAFATNCSKAEGNVPQLRHARQRLQELGRGAQKSATP